MALIWEDILKNYINYILRTYLTGFFVLQISFPKFQYIFIFKYGRLILINLILIIEHEK